MMSEKMEEMEEKSAEVIQFNRRKISDMEEKSADMSCEMRRKSAA